MPSRWIRVGRVCVVALVSSAVLATVGALSTSAGAASSNPPTTTTSVTGGFAPYPTGAITPLAQSGNITAGGCTYQQAIDDPHLSSGDTSVHGWWVKVSGTCPSKATVTVYLQAYFCGGGSCGWETLNHGQGDYYAGGGSGNRATARWTCSDTSPVVGWRGYVDVDLDGVSDPSGYTYSTIQNLPCYP